MWHELGVILKIFASTSMPWVPADQNGSPTSQKRYIGWIQLLLTGAKSQSFPNLSLESF